MFIHFLSTGCDYGAPALAIWFAVPGSADSRTLRGAHLHPSLLLFSITVGDLKFNNNCLHAPISLCSLILATSPQVLVWKDINYCDPLVTIICKVPTLMANLSQLISGGKKKKKKVWIIALVCVKLDVKGVNDVYLTNKGTYLVPSWKLSY